VKNHAAAQTLTSKTGTGNTWTKHTQTFSMGASATSATIFLYIPASVANSVVDVDDFFLAESLTAGWTATDIGSVGLAGESGMRGGRWVLRGSGSDISSTADSHRFVHTGLTGDGAVTARLRSFENAQVTSKSGVMMRASLSADSAIVHLGWRGDDRMETIRRTATAASATADLGAVGGRVEWVRIHRLGNVFTTSHSPDGIMWTTFGAPQTIAMPATIFAGLSACATTTTDWTETSAENLSVAPDTAPTITGPADQSIGTNSATAALALTVGDDFTSAFALALTKASSNPTLVPTSGIVFGGSGANRTVTVTPAANQLGTATIATTVSDGARTASDTFVLTVTGTALETWRFANFGTTANIGPAADTFDANHDGELNLLEYATAQNAKASSLVALSAIRTASAVEITYTRSKAALNGGVTFAAEWSDTLASNSWSTAGVTQAILTDNGTVQTVKATIPTASGILVRFARLKAASP
jgi:hypothetical protein